ncbi:hypothetical protein LCM10_16290 [Rossellomorea aquimaris]|nr:hypothetical protein [Rossellomorea aquimaris]MCA1056561.1 hypothetical protein [Rossellomorea aquimaris]
MLGILYLPVLCFIIIGGGYLALEPINFFTVKDRDDPFDSLFNDRM